MEQTTLRFLQNHPYSTDDRDRIVGLAEELGGDAAVLVNALVEDAAFQDARREDLEAALTEIGDIVKGAI